MLRADSRFAPSQWEMALLCNDVSHWSGASLESALHADFQNALAYTNATYVDTHSSVMLFLFGQYFPKYS